jgi:hypothetical protein
VVEVVGTIRGRFAGAILLLLLSASVAEAAVELTVITPKGHITFVAEDEWEVIATQTQLPVAVVAFQIKDGVDEGTPHSTNLALGLHDPGSAKGREAIKGIGRKYGASPPKVSRVGDWQVFDQQAAQQGAIYTILDARRDLADVTVSVRLAWPTLKRHARDHDSVMRDLFRKFLGNVRGRLGPHEAKPGEVIRRPSSPTRQP